MLFKSALSKLYFQASILTPSRVLCHSVILNCPAKKDNETLTQTSESKLSRAKKLLPKRYEIFDDENTKIIFDNQFDLDVILNKKQKRIKQTKPIVDSSLRGKEGVFDIDELVVLLREENMTNIATVEVPKELKYCHYMVMCTANSERHIKNFVSLFNKIYKIKKSNADPFLNLDDDGQNWKLIDLGNIVLHLFLEDAREFYDIESLWTVGEEFDDKIQKPDIDIVSDIMSKHMDFIELQSKNVNQ